MKLLFFSVFLFLPVAIFPQNIQVQWDLRHTIDAKLNSKNFPSFSFEYFANIDTIGTGSFLFKLDSRMDGNNSNPSQIFTQISQSIKFWKPKIYLSATYSGGLGVTSTYYGYYISNSFGIGPAYAIKWKEAWISASTYLRVNVFDKPSLDPQVNLWFGRFFLNYRIYFSGSFVFWSQNRDQGNEDTKELRGKKIAFFGDPQIWFKIKKRFSAGSKINIYYHLLSDDNHVQVYPTIGLKYQFN